MTRLRTAIAGTRTALVGALAAAMLLTGCVASAPVTLPVQFEDPLAIPPLAPSQVAPDGTRVFSLTAGEGSREIVPGLSTRTWGFNGDVLGPTLRAKRGEKVAVEVTNQLPEVTTVHWHGMHLPAAMDGGPHQMIEPGGTWRPTWTIDQPPATLWYHPRPHGTTEEHVYRGLAGMFLLDDASRGATGLPSRYGVDDIPMIVQDKDLDRDGQLVLDDQGNEIGMLGGTILVNGTHGPYLEVTTELVRLRLLNGSTARTYDFGFDGNRRFQLVGTDGGLLPAPHATERVRLSPGERAEVVVSWEINGRRMEMDRIDEIVGEGTTEVWEVINRNPFPHNFHVHDVQFQVLTIDGTPPTPELAGRKDTVFLEPQRHYRLIMQFEDFADDRTPVHAPLPSPAARGRGNDGSVRR